MLAQAFDQVFNPRVRARHGGHKRSKETEEETEEEFEIDGAASQVGMK
jgi:hypothetical protein